MSQRLVIESEASVLDRSLSSGLLGRMSHTWHHQQRQPPSRGSILETEVSTNDDLTGLKARVARQLYAHVENDTAFYTLSCAARPRYLVRVGPGT